MNPAVLSSLLLALLVNAENQAAAPQQQQQLEQKAAKAADAFKGRGWGRHHHHHHRHHDCDPTTEDCTSTSTETCDPTTEDCSSSIVPPCHAPVCPFSQGGLTIVKADTVQKNAAQVCRDHGFYPADITAFNWVDATDLAFKCSGAFSATWIHSYWENTFDGECLALYTGASAPGGAIAPADCGDRLNVLCSINKPEGWVGNQQAENDSSCSHDHHHHHHHHGHHHDHHGHHHHHHHHHDHDNVLPQFDESSSGQYEYDSSNGCGRPDFVDPEFESTSSGCPRDYVRPYWGPQPVYGCESSSSGPAVSWHGPIRPGSSVSDRMATSGDYPCREIMWKQENRLPRVYEPQKNDNADKKESAGKKEVHEMTPGRKN